jgi:Na+-driven multidrug efflux pump
MPLGMATDAMRRFKTHMLIRASGVAMLAALMPGFVVRWGLVGAAQALVIGFALMVVAYAAAIFAAVARPVRNPSHAHRRPRCTTLL